MKKALKWIFITLISIPIILVIAYYFLIFVYVMWHLSKDDEILRKNKFNQTLWMKAITEEGHLDWDHKANCTRGKMYYDLVDNHLSVGKRKEEVFKMLGKPYSERRYFDNKDYNNCYRYDLGGSCSISSGPPRILLVCFKKGLLIDYFYSTVNDKGETFLLEEEIE